MEFKIGQIVLSCAGRDKGEYFIVMSIEDNFLYLVDGDMRKIDKPKKKKTKHIKPIDFISQFFIDKVEVKGKASNSDVRNAIKEYLSSCED